MVMRERAVWVFEDLSEGYSGRTVNLRLSGEKLRSSFWVYKGLLKVFLKWFKLCILKNVMFFWIFVSGFL